MLQRERNVRRIANLYQIERRVPDIDLPIPDSRRMTHVLDAMASISLRSVAAPQGCAPPARILDCAVQLCQPLLRRARKRRKFRSIELEGCRATALPTIIEEKKKIAADFRIKSL